MISSLTLIPLALFLVCLFLAWMLYEEKKENKFLTRYILDLKSPESLVRANIEQKTQNKKIIKENLKATNIENTYQDVIRKRTMNKEEKKVLEMEKLLK